MSSTTFTPGPTPNTVRAADGKVLTVPAGYFFLRVTLRSSFTHE